MNIEFDVEISEFKKEKFIFWVHHSDLILSYYSLLERESKKHKFKSVKYYDRIMKRNSNINIDEVPLTDSVKEKAKKLFIDKIKITV